MARNINTAFSLLVFFGILQLISTATAATIQKRADDYHVVAVDQKSNTVRVFPRNAKKWDSDAIFWSFKADPPFYNDDWLDLSDAKIRKSAKHGWIALVTASRGKAGVINVTKEKRSVTLDDDEVLWQATPGDNPHAIERIPYNGALVVASSHPGKLTLYVPTGDSVSDYSKFRLSDEKYEFEGAHGVLWDPNGGKSAAKGILWAVGEGVLRKYKVVGSGKKTRLEQSGKDIKLPGKAGLGHDLQPDYTNKDTLLVTDSYGAYSYNIKKDKWTELQKIKRVKSLVRTPDDEYMWVQGGKETQLGEYVSFGPTVEDGGDEESKHGWKGAEFYKARIYGPDFE